VEVQVVVARVPRKSESRAHVGVVRRGGLLLRGRENVRVVAEMVVSAVDNVVAKHGVCAHRGRRRPQASKIGEGREHRQGDGAALVEGPALGGAHLGFRRGRRERGRDGGLGLGNGAMFRTHFVAHRMEHVRGQLHVAAWPETVRVLLRAAAPRSRAAARQTPGCLIGAAREHGVVAAWPGRRRRRRGSGNGAGGTVGKSPTIFQQTKPHTFHMSV